MLNQCVCLVPLQAMFSGLYNREPQVVHPQMAAHMERVRWEDWRARCIAAMKARFPPRPQPSRSNPLEPVWDLISAICESIRASVNRWVPGRTADVLQEH